MAVIFSSTVSGKWGWRHWNLGDVSAVRSCYYSGGSGATVAFFLLLFLFLFFIRGEMRAFLYLWGDPLKDSFNILAMKGRT
jgi:hypothetical protein